MNTENVQPYDKPYEGYVWAEVGHFSYYALAGQARSPAVPGLAWWGSVVLVMLLGGMLVWLVRRRQRIKY